MKRKSNSKPFLISCVAAVIIDDQLAITLNSHWYQLTFDNPAQTSVVSMCFAVAVAGCDNYPIVYNDWVELRMVMIGWSPDLAGTIALISIIFLVTYIGYRESHPLAWSLTDLGLSWIHQLWIDLNDQVLVLWNFVYVEPKLCRALPGVNVLQLGGLLVNLVSVPTVEMAWGVQQKRSQLMAAELELQLQVLTIVSSSRFSAVLRPDQHCFPIADGNPILP